MIGSTINSTAEYGTDIPYAADEIWAEKWVGIPMDTVLNVPDLNGDGRTGDLVFGLSLEGWDDWREEQEWTGYFGGLRYVPLQERRIVLSGARLVSVLDDEDVDAPEAHEG